MDFLAQLPAPGIPPRTENSPANARTSGPKGQQAAEAGALSFSGILEGRQTPAAKDSPEKVDRPTSGALMVSEAPEAPQAQGVQKLAEAAAPLESVSVPNPGQAVELTAPTPVAGMGSPDGQSIPLPVNLTGLMRRLQAGQLARQVPAEALPGTASAEADQMVKVPGEAKGSQQVHPAQVDIQPTGGRGQIAKPILNHAFVEAAAGTGPELPAKSDPGPAGTAPAVQVAPSASGEAQEPSALKSAAPQPATGVPVAQEAIPPSDSQVARVAQDSGSKEKSGDTGSQVIAGPKPLPVGDMAGSVAGDTADSADQETEEMTSPAPRETPVQEGVVAGSQDENSPALQHAAAAKDASADAHHGAETQTLSAETAVPTGRPASLDSTAPTGRIQNLETGRAIRQQVITQLASSLDGRIGQEKVVLQLNPEKLGQVEIQLAARGNDLSVVITASNGEAEQAIREGIKELAEGITDKSARWQQVDIKVEQRSQDQEKNDTRNDGRRDQQRREDQSKGQQHHQRRPDGMPDWASLRGEG